jgi:hypothetical protein
LISIFALISKYFFLKIKIEKGQRISKAGTQVRSKSLSVFMKQYQPAYAIRVSQKNFGFEDRIKSVPLYAAFCL